MSRKDQLLRILFALDRHFDDDRISPSDVERWDELKRRVVRMKEGLELALGELVSGAPANEDKVRKALGHVLSGSERRAINEPHHAMKTHGTLRQLPSGEWAIQVSGREPVRILAGEVFMVEVGGKMKRTGLAQRADGKHRSSTGLELRDGMRAGFYNGRECHAKIITKR